MKPSPFEDSAPVSLEEALDAVVEARDEATMLAGGQSLVPLRSWNAVAPFEPQIGELPLSPDRVPHGIGRSHA